MSVTAKSRAVLVALAFCGCQRAPVLQESAATHFHHMDVHWVTVADAPSLARESTLVVRAHVLSGRELPAVASKAPPMTLSLVRVDEVLSAATPARSPEAATVRPGATLEVEELGGHLPDGCLLAPDDAPPLIPGEDQVLFLSAHLERRGAYVVVGGYQGRLKVEAEQLAPLSFASHPERRFELDAFAGRPYSELAPRVKAWAEGAP